MKKFVGIMVVAAVGLIVGIGASNAAGIKEGKWTITMTTKMDGAQDHASEMQEAMANMTPEEKATMEKMMGGMNIQMGAEGMTTSTTHCVTQDNPVPEMEELEGCQTTHEISGDVVTFESTCADSHSSGTLTYSDDAMNGVITSTKTENGEETGVTIELTGQYEGPCS